MDHENIDRETTGGTATTKCLMNSSMLVKEPLTPVKCDAAEKENTIDAMEKAVRNFWSACRECALANGTNHWRAHVMRRSDWTAADAWSFFFRKYQTDALPVTFNRMRNHFYSISLRIHSEQEEGGMILNRRKGEVFLRPCARKVGHTTHYVGYLPPP